MLKLTYKKLALILVLLTYVLIYSFFYPLLGSTYYTSVWSFRTVYPANYIIENQFFPPSDSFSYLEPDTTFFSLEGALKASRSILVGSTLFLIVSSVISGISPTVLSSSAFLVMFLLTSVLYLYSVFKREGTGLYLFAVILLSLFLNPVLLPVSHTFSVFIFFGMSQIIYLLSRLNMASSAGLKIKYVSLISLTLILLSYVYYTALYVSIFLLTSAILLVFFYSLFIWGVRGKIHVYSEIPFLSGTKQAGVLIISVAFLFLILFIFGGAVFDLIAARMDVFLNLPRTFTHFVTYYLSHKLMATPMESSMGLTYIQPLNYRLSLIGYLLSSLLIIGVFYFLQLREICTKRIIIITNTRFLINVYFFACVLIIPFAIATNALDRVFWFVFFGLALIFAELFNSYRRQFFYLFSCYVVISALVFSPIIASPSHLGEVYRAGDLRTYDWILSHTNETEIVWTDLKASSYLITKGHTPMTIVEGSYQGTSFTYPIERLYTNTSLFVETIARKHANYMLITKDMLSDDGLFYSYNFYLKPPGLNVTDAFDDMDRVDKIFNDGNYFYIINK